MVLIVLRYVTTDCCSQTLGVIIRSVLAFHIIMGGGGGGGGGGGYQSVILLIGVGGLHGLL